MKKRKYNTGYSLGIGVRLFIAGLLVLCGMALDAFIPFAILATVVSRFPMWRYSRASFNALAEGVMEDEEVEKTARAIARKLERYRDEMQERIDADGNSLKNIVLQQGVELTKLKERTGTPGPWMSATGGSASTLESFLRTQKSKFDDLRDGKTSNLKLTIPGSVVKALVSTASVVNSTTALVLGTIGQIQTPLQTIRSLFKQDVVEDGQGGAVRFIDTTELTRGAGMVLEGNTKPESSITWGEFEAKLKKVADSVVITREILKDFDWAMREIQSFLLKNLAMKIDSQLWSGNNVGANLHGIFTRASEFAYDGPAVSGPNVYDLGTVVRASIIAEGASKFNPTVAVINPLDGIASRLLKDTMGRYLLASNPDGSVSFGGVRFVESAQVEQNTMLIGDFSAGAVYSNGIDLDIGTTGSQFIENKLTVLGEERTLLLVRTVDLPGFKKISDIESTLATLESPGS